MSRGLRTALWILSSLGVLWTITAIAGLFTAGGMACPGCAGMMGERGMMESDVMMGGMMFQMILTWIIMLGLDALFVYLLITARRGPRLQRV